jgi:hypothetical protein
MSGLNQPLELRERDPHHEMLVRPPAAVMQSLD